MKEAGSGASAEVESVRQGGAPLLVEIFGEKYWLIEGLDAKGPVSQVEHCHEDGQLNYATCFSSDTFAHWFPERNEIMRYGRRIGGREDIMPLLVERSKSEARDLSKEADAK